MDSLARDLPRTRTFGISRGPKLWTLVPNSLLSVNSLMLLRSKRKTHLLRLASIAHPLVSLISDFNIASLMDSDYIVQFFVEETIH